MPACLLAGNAGIWDIATVTPTIKAVDDDFTGAPINGNGGITATIITNDLANGAAAVIGGNVTPAGRESERWTLRGRDLQEGLAGRWLGIVSRHR